MDSLRAHALLARTPSLKAEHLHALVQATGSVEAAACLGARHIPGIGLPASSQVFLAAPDEAAIDADLAWLETSGAHLILCTSADYPPLLAQISKAPSALYVLGDVAALSSPQIAMVGSRSSTASGCSIAREFARNLARIGLTITSGLALGIDGASHEGALEGEGITIAVCGRGLDKVYPRQHAALATRIREHGALVSEFPPRTQPLPAHFPQRNRIISGLSFGTLVVEAALTSGSLLTAKHAGEQGREVFAIPGSIRNPLSRGCHKLIRDGAKLVEGVEDVRSEILNFLGPQSLALSPMPLRANGDSAPPLDKEYEILLDALGFEPASIDVLAARTKIPSESIASMLLILELQGRIEPHAGGRYGRLP